MDRTICSVSTFALLFLQDSCCRSLYGPLDRLSLSTVYVTLVSHVLYRVDERLDMQLDLRLLTAHTTVSSTVSLSQSSHRLFLSRPCRSHSLLTDCVSRPCRSHTVSTSLHVSTTVSLYCVAPTVLSS